MSKFIMSVAAAMLVLTGMFAAALILFSAGVFVGFTYINSMCSKEFSVIHRFDKPSYACEPFDETVHPQTEIRETVEPALADVKE